MNEIHVHPPVAFAVEASTDCNDRVVMIYAQTATVKLFCDIGSPPCRCSPIPAGNINAPELMDLL